MSLLSDSDFKYIHDFNGDDPNECIKCFVSKNSIRNRPEPRRACHVAPQSAPPQQGMRLKD